jgi:PII-like signaling protein
MMMTLQTEQTLLRAYLRNADRSPHMPTFERVVHAARDQKLSGSMVLRGILGAGYHGILQNRPWSLAEHVPIVVEIVDTAEKIAAFVQGPLDRIMIGGMITLERAAVMMYREQPDDTATRIALAAPLKPLSTLPQIQAGDHMQINEQGILLRVFIGESDEHEHQPLYQAIVQKVWELDLAGATVLRGTEGFGARSVVHTSRLLEMSTDLPVVIEIVDSQDKINLLLPHLESMVQQGMVTMEYVMILMYRHRKADDSTEGMPEHPDSAV